MKNKLLSNLTYTLTAAMGALTLILFAFPYVTAKMSFFGISESESKSGYGVMGGDAEGLNQIVAILLFLVGLAMLLYGGYNLLRKLDVLKDDIIPDKFCNTTYAQYGLYAYAGLSVVLMITMFIWCGNQDASDYGASIYPSAGLWITVIVAVGAVVADKILPEKLNLGEDAPEAPVVSDEEPPTAE